MINLDEILRELYDRKLVLDRAIRELEKMQQAGRPASFLKLPKLDRRGRKSMGEAERQEVAARMKRYWAGRQKTQHATD